MPKTFSKPATQTCFVLVVTTLCAISCTPQINSVLKVDGKVGEPLEYRITATNSPTSFNADVPPPEGLGVDTTTGIISGVPEKMGIYKRDISATNSSGAGQPAKLQITIGNAVVVEKELLIIDPQVVQDANMVGKGKPWHIRTVLQRIAGTMDDAQVEAFAQAWFALWDDDRKVNAEKYIVPKQPSAAAAMRKAWKDDNIKLLAIVNRIDLAAGMIAPGQGVGEGRFVYQVIDGLAEKFTFIVEFQLPIAAGEDRTAALNRWANRWHALGKLEGNDYLKKLAGITADFSAHGNLNQIRTNHLFNFLLVGWNLREFHFHAPSSRMVQAMTNQSPDRSHLASAEMKQFITDKEQDILEGTAGIPLALIGGRSGQGERVEPPGVVARARFIVSFNTCIGCHTGTESNIKPFQHIKNFQKGQPATLSNFMTGEVETKAKLPSHETSKHNEMMDRRTLLLHWAEGVKAVPHGVAEAANQREIDDIIRARRFRVH